MIDVDALLLGARVLPTEGTGVLPTPDLPRAVACSDDLWIGGVRLCVRAFVSPRGAGSWVVDLRDSSTAEDVPGLPILALDDVRVAAVAAFSDALRLRSPDARLASRIELLTDASTWVGGPAVPCPAAERSFAIARVYDAIAGALALAWLDPGRAGSCSLGAIVTATDDRGDALVDVVAGGRGAELQGPGDSAWPGPVITPGTLCNALGVAIEHAPRPESGGVGARNGGDGVSARYTFTRPATVRIALDRITNPPHGLDRAGPPLPADARLVAANGETRTLEAWRAYDVAAGDRVEVDTAGGAGHGFPGWGIDFEWE
jgi:hypothetical protein